MNLDREDLQAIADLLDALNAWRAKHPYYVIDGTTIWGEGDELIAVGLNEECTEYCTYPLDNR